MEVHDFLTPGPAQIRHQLINIVESYNHDWDLFAELAQNSVDAITLLDVNSGRIKVEVFAAEKKIVFEDNGCGISPEEIVGLLTPFSTSKEGSQNLIGQKGVGISFVIFLSAHFEIESYHESGASRASIDGANAWLDAKNEELPRLTFEHITFQKKQSNSFGTKITVKLPKNSENEFWSYTFDQLAMVLLTRTALGDVRTIWKEQSNKSLSLTVNDLNGGKISKKLKCSYFLPITKLKESQFISLHVFKEWIQSGDRSDLQKRQKLQDRVVVFDGEKDVSLRRIQFWACFVPKRKSWDIISVNSKLVDRSILDLSHSDRIDEFGDAQYLFSSGLFTSTRGMPTGINSGMKARGWAGYIPNFFIIINDPQLSFDIGRKSIPGRQLGKLRDIADEVFKEILRDIAKYISGNTESPDEDFNRSVIFNDIRNLPDLNSQYTSFIKRPSHQEATIAAIFYELLGANQINDLQPYTSGYKNRYDLYAKYKGSDVVIEFKSTLTKLFQDFDDTTKLFDEIDIVVIWEITEDDYGVVNTHGFGLDEIHPGLSTGNESLFHFRLTFGPTSPIRVICLKHLLFPDARR